MKKFQTGIKEIYQEYNTFAEEALTTTVFFKEETRRAIADMFGNSLLLLKIQLRKQNQGIEIINDIEFNIAEQLNLILENLNTDLITAKEQSIQICYGDLSNKSLSSNLPKKSQLFEDFFNERKK